MAKRVMYTPISANTDEHEEILKVIEETLAEGVAIVVGKPMLGLKIRTIGNPFAVVRLTLETLTEEEAKAEGAICTD